MITAALSLVTALSCGLARPEGHATVRVRCGQGDATIKLEMPSYGGPSSLDVVPVASETWVVRSEAGGSDVHFWWLPVRMDGERLVSRLRTPIETTSQDAVCVSAGAFAGVLRFVWGNQPGESHHAPHRYEFTPYAVDTSGMYVRSGHRRTRSRHESWKGAAVALDLKCDNVVELVARPVKAPPNNALQRTKPAQAMELRR